MNLEPFLYAVAALEEVVVLAVFLYLCTPHFYTHLTARRNDQMGITTEKKVVARCDLEGCKSVRYGTDDVPPVGFVATIEQIVEDADGVRGYTTTVYGCSMAHVNKEAQRRFREGMEIDQKIYSRDGGQVAAGADG